MDEKTQNSIIKKGNEIALATADAIISVLLPLQPIQYLTSVTNSYNSIKEELFYEKLKSFLGKAENVTERERDAFLRVLDKDKDAFFKRLFVVIDRLDGTEKAEIIGNLFRAFIQGKMEATEFFELVSIIEIGYIKDVRFFIEKYSKQPIPLRSKPFGSNRDSQLKKLSNIGLLESQSSTFGTQTTETFNLTEIGKILVKYGGDGSKRM
jgi:hypothetical protein